jgi:hypothetical protein
MIRRKVERRIDGWSFRYFSRQWSVFSRQSLVVSPKSGGKYVRRALFIAPDFSLGIPRLKPWVISLVSSR